MPPNMLFDYLGVRLNGPRAAGKKIALNVDFTDLKQQYGLTVENGVLNYAPRKLSTADASLSLAKATLDDIQLRRKTLDQAIASGDLKIDGSREAFTQFMGLLDDFPFWFNIVTP